MEKSSEKPESMSVLVVPFTPVTREVYADLAPIKTPTITQVMDLFDRLKNVAVEQHTPLSVYMSDETVKTIEKSDAIVNSATASQVDIYKKVLIMLGQSDLVQKLLEEPNKVQTINLSVIKTPTLTQVADLVSDLRVARVVHIDESRSQFMTDSAMSDIIKVESIINDLNESKAELLSEMLTMLGQADVVKQVTPTNDYPYSSV
jgi:hypothetical protein